MRQYTDIFNVLLRRGMPASSPLTDMAIAHRIRQIAVLGLQVTADKASAEPEKSQKASPLKGKGKSKGAPATPEPSGKGKGSTDTSKGKGPAADDATAGIQSGHTYFALETLVTCARVCKTWRAALVTSGIYRYISYIYICMHPRMKKFSREFYHEFYFTTQHKNWNTVLFRISS